MTWVDIANLIGPEGKPGEDGQPGPPGPVNVGLRVEDPITYAQGGGFTFNLVDGSAQTVNIPIATAQSAGLLRTSSVHDISDQLVNASGTVTVQRFGAAVILTGKAVIPASELSSGGNFLRVPVGFRPIQRRDFSLSVGATRSSVRSAFQFASGAMGVWAPSTDDSYSFEHVYITGDSWSI